jgi:hypothetical protein
MLDGTPRLLDVSTEGVMSAFTGPFVGCVQ